jgi:hypothetical protein
VAVRFSAADTRQSESRVAGDHMRSGVRHDLGGIVNVRSDELQHFERHLDSRTVTGSRVGGRIVMGGAVSGISNAVREHWRENRLEPYMNERGRGKKQPIASPEDITKGNVRHRVFPFLYRPIPRSATKMYYYR